MSNWMKIGTQLVMALAVAAGVMVVDGNGEGVQQVGATEVEIEGEEITAMQEGPTVRRQLLHRSGRFEIAPQGTFTVNDAFMRNVMPGLGVSYYLNNIFGVMGGFSFGALQMDTSLRRQMDANGVDDVSYSRVGWSLDGGLVYVPAFGKFTMMNAVTTHYDFHLFGGFAMVNEVGEAASENGSVDPEQEGVRPGAMFGAGLRFFLGDSVSLNFQARNYLMPRAQEVSGGDSDPPQLGNTMMFTTGIGIYWPGEVQISR